MPASADQRATAARAAFLANLQMNYAPELAGGDPGLDFTREEINKDNVERSY